MLKKGRNRGAPAAREVPRTDKVPCGLLMIAAFVVLASFHVKKRASCYPEPGNCGKGCLILNASVPTIPTLRAGQDGGGGFDLDSAEKIDYAPDEHD